MVLFLLNSRNSCHVMCCNSFMPYLSSTGSPKMPRVFPSPKTSEQPSKPLWHFLILIGLQESLYWLIIIPICWTLLIWDLGFWGSQHLGRASYNPQHSNLHQASNRGWLVAPHFDKNLFNPKSFDFLKFVDEGCLWLYILYHFIPNIWCESSHPLDRTCG